MAVKLFSVHILTSNSQILVKDVANTVDSLSISNSQGTRDFVRDRESSNRERKLGYSLHKGNETLVRHRERFEIEGVRDRESQLYVISLK